MVRPTNRDDTRGATRERDAPGEPRERPREVDEPARDRYADLFERAPVGYLALGDDGAIVEVNRLAAALLGASREALCGESLASFVVHGDLAAYEIHRLKLSERGAVQVVELRLVRRGAAPFWARIEANRDAGPDGGAVTRVVLSEVSQRLRDAAARLDFLAHHDALTGLPNRLLLFDRIEHGIDAARRGRCAMALLMLDLDHFKDVNDGFGHLAGDELLQLVARRLTARLRGVDTVTRLGGDEFAVLLEGIVRPRDAALVAKKIIDALAEPWRLSNGAEVHVGVSVGISLFPEHGRSAEELLERADAALYRAKTEGRGRFRFFSDDLTHAALRRINLEAMLRAAIERDALRLHYQPQFELRSGRIVGAEALLRWSDPGEGAIEPAQFIPVAEETGLISTIGAWVIGEACRQGRRWIDAGLEPLRIAVNLSPRQLRHGDVCATVSAALAASGFPPAMLELELTERALIDREEESDAILKRLRGIGVRIAIDDFGSGYSSLAHLRRFPLDALKIDRSFVRDLATRKDHGEIVSAIIAVAHSMSLSAVAVGVEREEQLAFLTGRGCDAYQGHLKSPAVDADAFEALCATRV